MADLAGHGMFGRRGVRARVTLVAAIAFAGVLAVVAVALVTTQRQSLTESLDELLVTRAAGLAAAWERGGVGAGTGGDDLVWQAIDADGEVIGASRVLDGLDPLVTPDVGDGPAMTSPRTLGGGPLVERLGDRVRTVTVVANAPDTTITLAVFATLDDVDEAVTVLAGSLLAAVPAATAMLALLVWWFVGRALAPVEAIRSQVAAISGDDLDRRVAVPAAGDEVARLAVTMNAMLDRLEAAAAAQRRFAADASHELRTPLTRLRAQLETTRAGDDLEALRASLLQDTDDMQDLVEDLLLLARMDEGRRPTAALLDLDVVVLEAVSRLAPGSVRVDTSAVSGAAVVGDSAGLARVVRNLLSNAVRHAPGRVVIDLDERDGEVVLVVADDGPGIAAEDVDRVFERFTRLDDARTRADGGAGLGLAIVAEVVAQHGGTVAVDRGEQGGARFTVQLPSATASRSGILTGG